jgi:hypothetical protein
MLVTTIMQFGVAGFSLMAAIFWFCTYLVKMLRKIAAMAPIGGIVTSKDFDVLVRGLRNQGILNSLAAICAAAAAILQFTLTVLRLDF